MAVTSLIRDPKGYCAGRIKSARTASATYASYQMKEQDVEAPAEKEIARRFPWKPTIKDTVFHFILTDAFRTGRSKHWNRGRLNMHCELDRSMKQMANILEFVSLPRAHQQMI